MGTHPRSKSPSEVSRRDRRQVWSPGLHPMLSTPRASTQGLAGSEDSSVVCQARCLGEGPWYTFSLICNFYTFEHRAHGLLFPRPPQYLEGQFRVRHHRSLRELCVQTIWFKGSLPPCRLSPSCTDLSFLTRKMSETLQRRGAGSRPTQSPMGRGTGLGWAVPPNSFPWNLRVSL